MSISHPFFVIFKQIRTFDIQIKSVFYRMNKELIGKQYQYKLVPDQIKIVQDVNNDTVIFNDGGRVPLNRLDEMFQLIGGGIKEMIVEENGEETVDPTKFFDMQHRQVFYQKMKKDIESIDTTNVPQQMVTTNPTIGENISEPPVKRYNIETTEDGKIVTREENSPMSSVDFLKKMKRSNQVEISIKWVENIPNLDFIKMMDENFDHGVLDYLVDDITEKMTASPKIIANQIRTQLSQMLENGKIKRPNNKTKTKKIKKNEKVEQR